MVVDQLLESNANMIEYTDENYISIWIGSTEKSIDDFNKYTDGMETGDGKCQACIDFGVKFIDSDFFVAFGTEDNAIIPIEDLVEEIDVSSQEVLRQIISAAKEKGVTEGNSLYYYKKAKFTEEISKKYNDLIFIGVFYDQKKKKK